MLTHPMIEKLESMRLWGMSKAYREQMEMSDSESLSFEERMGLLVDREMTERENRRLVTRLRKAKLRLAASMEDIDYRKPRGLDKSLMLALASCQWIRESRSLLITGPTGAGKTYLACALAHRACLEGYSALYKRLPVILREISVAKGDGSYPKLMRTYARTDLLSLDDWGLSRLTQEQRLDLLELLEDRYNMKSTLVAAQVPVDQWHETIGDPTLADAILDRLVHNSYRIKLKGESMRKRQSGLTDEKQPA